MKNISCIRGNRNLLRSVDMEVNRGELIGLIGPNGAGKSTLLSIAAGLIKPDTGGVFLENKPLSSHAAIDRARKLGWLEQSGSIHWPVSVERLVMLGRIPHATTWNLPADVDIQAVDKAMELCDCIDLRNRKATTLSGGERARAMLARALAGEPNILLADEPTASLDPRHQLQMMDVLHQFVANDRSVVVVLHDLSLAMRYCDRIYLLHEGQVHSEGHPLNVLNKATLKEVYGISAIIGTDDTPWIIPSGLLTGDKKNGDTENTTE